MYEAQLQGLVLDECHRRGLWVLVIPDSRMVGPGWPDLVILGNGRALFVELKGTDTRMSREQIRMQARLSRAGLHCRVWRPGHWASGEIKLELDRLTT